MPARPPRLLVVALLTLAACGGSDASPTTTTAAESTTTAPPPTTTPADDEAAVLAAVEGYWRTIREANADPPNPAHPGFDEFFTGEARRISMALVLERQHRGQAVRLPADSVYGHDLHVVAVSEGTAVVSDCSVDDTVVFDIESGETVNAEIGTLLWETELRLDAGDWKVERNEIVRRWEGAVSCES